MPSSGSATALLWGVPVPFLVFLPPSGGRARPPRTAFGISVYMIGSNLEATRYSGIDTRRVLIGVYTLSSVLCFVAACLMLARFNSASAGYAQSYLLITILAAVLGGVDPFGGFGRISGLLLALVVLQVISSGCNLLGLSQHLTLAIWGLTLIAVMGVKIPRRPLAGGAVGQGPNHCKTREGTMNKLGVHALVWVGGWSEAECAKAISNTAELGYDFIEIPLFNPTVFRWSSRGPAGGA